MSKQKKNVVFVTIGCALILAIVVTLGVTVLHPKTPVTDEIRKEDPFYLKRALALSALSAEERQERQDWDKKMGSTIPYDNWQVVSQGSKTRG